MVESVDTVGLSPTASGRASSSLAFGTKGVAHMDNQRQYKINVIQAKTYQDTIRVLNKFHMCCIERPTGFGKTAMFMRMCRENPDKQFLFVYASASMKRDIQDKYKPTNVAFISYALISRTESRAKVLIDWLIENRYIL